ncbi:hypothetical protein MTBPR1_60172 [Candidatus Terasakiella magnetica]|uniref:Uncharacterized protein n=1 Tax=Candidatus Terasakiella magnetica TaxID=1867952 RepID=A0A1C3RKB2_9PROT|nr:hypothetical protein [Candidatus Terasakiella magnetica]SCA57659.1 hypothetical protein MTBPR1_60172 [Candidatus Terasakiella magnetica]
MTQVQSAEEFPEWLEGQDRWVSVGLAARIALRVLPTLGPVVQQLPQEKSSAFLLPSFRATAVPWLVGTRPSQGTELAAFAATAAAHAANAAYASYASAAAADAAAAAAAAAYAADSATIAAAAIDVDIWHEINQDIALLEDGATVEELMERPLWGKVPEELHDHWQELKQAVLALDENWQVWTQWYEDRLIGGPKPNGRPVYYPLEKERVLIPDEDWEKGPAHINGLIAEMELRYRGVQPQRPAPIKAKLGDDGVLHREDSAPAEGRDEGHSQRLRANWNGLQAHLKDFLNLDRLENHQILKNALKRYEKDFGESFEQLQVIELGIAGEVIADHSEQAGEQYMDDIAIDLKAFVAAHNQFITQFPEWQASLEDRVDPIGEQEKEAIVELGDQIIEAEDRVDEDIRDSLAELLADLRADPADRYQKARWVGTYKSISNIISAWLQPGYEAARNGALLGVKLAAAKFVYEKLLGSLKKLENYPDFWWVKATLNYLKEFF